MRVLRHRRGCYGVEIATALAPRNDNILNSEQLRRSGSRIDAGMNKSRTGRVVGTSARPAAVGFADEDQQSDAGCGQDGGVDPQ